MAKQNLDELLSRIGQQQLNTDNQSPDTVKNNKVIDTNGVELNLDEISAKHKVLSNAGFNDASNWSEAVPQLGGVGKSVHDEQINPANIENIAEIRANDQSAGEQVALGLGRLVGTTGTKFFEGLGYTATAIPALIAGDAGVMTDNAWSTMWANAEQSIKDAMPIYHTNVYTQGNVLDKMGTLGFWMDDMIDGAAFMASAYLGGYATTPFKIGSKVAGVYGKLAQNFSKALRLEKTGVATGKSIGNLSKLAHEIDLGTMTLMNSSMEAGFEAKDTKNQLFQTYKQQGMSDEDANAKASEGALETFKANMLFLMPSNYIENSMLFKSFKGSKGAIEKAMLPNGLVNPETVANLTFKQKAAIFAKDAIGTGVVEGMYEENIQQAQQNYEKNMANGIASNGWINDIIGNMVENFTTNEGQQAIVTGFVLGMLPGGYGGIREAKAENKQLQKAQNALTLTTKLYRQKITDFYKRDEKGEIVTNPDGTPQLDKEKHLDAILGLMGKKESFDQKIAAALAGNKTMFNAIKDSEFSALAYSFFEQEAGGKFLEAQIDSMAKEEAKDFARVNDKDGSGLDLTPSRVANDYKERTRELQKLYDVIEERHAGFMTLPDTGTKESKEDAARFINRLKQVQFAEAASQTFWSKEQEKLQNELNGLLVDPKLEATPELQNRAKRLEKNIKEIDNIISESKETYKTLIDKKAQRELFTAWQEKKAKATEEASKPKEPKVESHVPKDISELQEGMKVKLHDGTIATYKLTIGKDGKRYHTFIAGKQKMTLVGDDELKTYLPNVTIMDDKSSVDIDKAETPEQVRAAVTETTSPENKEKANAKIEELEKKNRSEEHLLKLMKERLSKETDASLRKQLEEYPGRDTARVINQILEERNAKSADKIMAKYEKIAHDQRQADLEALFNNNVIEEMGTDGSQFKIKGDIYTVYTPNILDAIVRDKDGNIVAVKLLDKNGNKTEITSSKWVDQISYAIMLKVLADTNPENNVEPSLPQEVDERKRLIAESVIATRAIKAKDEYEELKEKLVNYRLDLADVLKEMRRLQTEFMQANLYKVGFKLSDLKKDPNYQEWAQFEKEINQKITYTEYKIKQLKKEFKASKTTTNLVKVKLQAKVAELQEKLNQEQDKRKAAAIKGQITQNINKIIALENEQNNTVQAKLDTTPVSGEQTTEGVQAGSVGETSQTQDQTSGSQTQGTQTPVETNKKKDESAVEAIKQQVAIDASELPSQPIPEVPKEPVKKKSPIEVLQTEFQITNGLPLRPIHFTQLKNGDNIILSTDDFALDKQGNLINLPEFNKGWLIKTKVSITADGKITLQPSAIEVKKENRNGPVFINQDSVFTRLSDGDQTQSAAAWNQINAFEFQFNSNNEGYIKSFSFYRIEESHMPGAVIMTANSLSRLAVRPELRPVTVPLQNAKGQFNRTIDGSEYLDFEEDENNKLQLSKLSENTLKGNPITVHYEDLSNPSITAGTTVEYVLIENDWYTANLKNKTWDEADNWKQAPIYIRINGRLVDMVRAYKSESEHGGMLDRKFIYDNLKAGKQVFGSIIKSKLKSGEEVNKLTGPTNLNNISVENRKNNLREPRYVSLKDSFSKLWTWDPDTNTYSIKDNLPIILATTEGTYKVGAKVPTIHIPEGIDPRIYNKMYLDSIDSTYVDDTSGHVFAIALNPLGEYRAIHLHTQALSSLAVAKVIEKFTTPNESFTKEELANINKIVHTKSIPQGAMSDEFYLNVTSRIINYMSPKTGKIIRIDLANFNKAIKGEKYDYSAVQITVNEEDKVKYTPDTYPANLDVLEDFKTFLSKKRYNVEAERLNKSDIKYKSEVTGQEYNNYLEYLTSPIEFTETKHVSDAKGILVSDIWNNKGTIYRDIGINLGDTRLQSTPTKVVTPEDVDKVAESMPTPPPPTKGKVEGIDLGGFKLPIKKSTDDKAHRLTAVKESYEKIDTTKAKAFLEKRFGKGILSFYPLVQAISEKGGFLAHGYVEKAAVHLYNNAEVGTEYHEAYHIAFRYMLSDKQREAILKEARQKYGDKSDLELEEKLAEDFRDYRMSEDSSSIPTKILNWFKNLLAYIKAIFTGNRDIQSLKRAISSNQFTKTENNNLTLSRKISDTFKPQTDTWSKTYSLKPGFTLQRQDEVLDSLTSDALDIIDTFDSNNKKIRVNDVLKSVRLKFINQIFIKDNGESVTLAEFNETIKTGVVPDNMSYNTDVYGEDALGAMFVVAMKWHDTIPDKKLGNITEVGWATLLKQKLEHFGIKIKGEKRVEDSEIEQYENQEDDDYIENQNDRIHGDLHFYTDTKDSLSAETRQWIARLRDNSKEVNFLGYKPYIPFDETYADILSVVSDNYSYQDMLNALREEAPYKPNLSIVLSELQSKNAYLQAQFFKSFALAYNRFVTAIEENEYPIKAIDANGEPVYGKPITQIKYIESNQEGTERKLMRQWKNNAFSNSSLKDKSIYVYNNTTNLYEVRQSIFKSLLEDLKEIQTINQTKLNEVTDDQVNALVSFINKIGINIPKEHIVTYLTKGIPLKGQMVNGARLYKYLTLPSKDNGSIGLINIMQSISDVVAENRLVKSAVIKSKPGDLYIDNASVIKRFALLEKLFATQKGGSFMDERNKSIYPYNLSTPIAEMITKIKEGKIDSDSIYWKDVWYNPIPSEGQVYTSPYLRLFQIQSFRDVFETQDFSAYKQRGQSVATQEYSLLHAVATKLNRYQAFLNNGDTNVSKLALQTLGDRDRMILVTVPRFDTYSKQLGYSSERDIWRSWLVQDIMAINKAYRETKELPNNMLRPNYHYSKKIGDGKGNGLKIRQIERTTIGDDLADRIEAFAKRPLVPSSEDMNALITESLDKIEEFIKAEVDSQINLLKEYELLVYLQDGKTIDKNQSRLSPKGMERYDWNIQDMVKDYVVNNMIFKNEIMKFTGIDYSIYKNMEDTSKRDTLLATPGTKQIIRGEIENDSEYGAEPMYTTAFSYDLYNNNRLAEESKSYRDFFKAVGDPLAEEIENQYSPDKPSVNRTDAQGFHSIHEQRNIMMGDGTWTDTHDRAYQNYKSVGVWEDPVTNKRPLLTAVKTSIDAHTIVNGTVVRVIIKHSSVVLLEEGTKKYPVLDDLRQRLELTGDYIPGEKYNKDGNLKIIRSLNFESTGKGSRWGMINIDEDSIGGRFVDLEQIEIPRENVRVPQVIPSENKKEDQLWGSQIRKIVLANLDLNSDSEDYTLNEGIVGKETKLTGRKLFDLYHAAGDMMLQKSLEALYRDLKYDPNQNDEKGRLDFLLRLRDILKKQNEQRDLPDNYTKVLDLYLDERNKYSFSVPLAFPSYMKKFEQIIFSLFKNNVLNQRIKGESAVQIAELGGHITDKGLKFIRTQTVEEWSRGKKKTVEQLTNKEREDYINSTSISHCECRISSSLAYKLGIKAGDREALKKIPEELRRMVGYRIPYSGKNLTLPLLIVDILPKESTHQIVVAAGITKQMGSDYDIDKLFLMMPNYAEDGYYEYINKRLNEEFGTKLISSFKSKDLYKNKELLKEVNTFKDNVKFALNTSTDDVIDNSEIDVIKGAHKKFEEEALSLNNSSDRLLVEKEWYDITQPLEDYSTAQLQNLILDITEAVIRSKKHFSEVMRPIDSPTIGDLAAEVSKATGESGIILNHNSPQTEEIIELRNKAGKTGIGIYATYLTGQAIGQYSDLKLRDGYSPVLMVDKSEVYYNDLSRQTVHPEIEGIYGDQVLNTLVNFTLSERAQSAVDNAKNPYMGLINDNTFTANVIGLFNTLGLGNKVVTYFLNQPIIRDLTEEYFKQNMTPNQIKDLVQEIGEKWISKVNNGKNKFNRLNNKKDDIKVTPMYPSKLRKSVASSKVEGLNPKQIEEQLDYLTNFYKFFLAGQTLAKINKAFNADRIKDMSNMGGIEEFQDNHNYVLFNNTVIDNADKVLVKDNWKLTKSYKKYAIDSALTFSEQFFPFRMKAFTNESGTGLKDVIKKGLNKDGLSKDIHNKLNTFAMLTIFSMKDSPLHSAFSKENVERMVLDNPNNMVNRFLTLKAKYPEVFSSNPFLNSLKENVKNIEEKEKKKTEIKLLSFENSYSYSADEKNEFVNGFEEAYFNSPHDDIKDFMRSLIDYSVVTRGFEQSPDTFIDFIPVEVWKDIKNASGQNVVEYFRSTYNSLNMESFFTDQNTYEQFIRNNVRMKGLVPSVDSDTKSAYAPEHTFDVNSYSSLSKEVDGDVHWADYFYVTDFRRGHTSLFRKDGIVGNVVKYKRIELLGEPNRLVEVNITDANGNVITRSINKKNEIKDLSEPSLSPTVPTSTTSTTSTTITTTTNKSATSKIIFAEDTHTTYQQRTERNASADATIAIAIDFTSAGEKLTKSAVLKQNKKYIPIDAKTLTVTKERVDKIVDVLNSVNAKTLNIAGNGIYTMKGKYTQEQVDDFTYELLKQVINHPNLKNKIESIRTGGQTGFDEAGAKAGEKLGITTYVLAPKGWKYRDVSGKDIVDEKGFKSRFNTKSEDPFTC